MSTEHQGQRAPLIDFIRGTAILGIVLVNVFAIGASDLFQADFMKSWKTVPFESNLLFLRANLLDNRIFPILSLLFGWGMAAQMERLHHAGKSVTHFFAKRYSLLFIIGFVHACFIWWGDVLMLYALCGFCLLALRNIGKKARWATIGLLFFFPFYIQVSRVANTEGIATVLGFPALDFPTFLSVYADGALFPIFKINLLEFINTNLKSTPFFLPKQLIMCFLGFQLRKEKKLLPFIETYRKKWWVYLLLVLLIILRIAGYTFLTGGIAHPILRLLNEWMIRFVELATSFGYLLILAQIFASRAFSFLRTPLGSVGRMSLSNYLAHSLIAAITFYIFGFYGQWLPSKLLLFGFTLFLATAALSVFWMKRFGVGPVEAIWKRAG